MKYALFLGCNIPARLKEYDLSARQVLKLFGVDIADIREFNCCGYPMKNSDFKTSLFLSARNLALAEKKNLDILTLCQCCFGTLKKAAHLLNEDIGLKDQVNAFLSKENLSYQGKFQVRHFLSVLHKEITPKVIKEKISNGFKNLKIAPHYGCHALRPSDVMQFDDPIAPVLFDELVDATGAKAVDWSLKTECCGAPVLGVNNELSMMLTEKKLASGKAAGADFLCAACPWCQLQFDTVQKQMEAKGNAFPHLPSILYPQLLGLSLGIPEEALGIRMNQKELSSIKTFLM
ncbi:MAG: CoB--CoM heterodisulfide reductase iron-sulfur subunit B family protein [Thermodesulfobacteriota bacterium]